MEFCKDGQIHQGLPRLGLGDFSNYIPNWKELNKCSNQSTKVEQLGRIIFLYSAFFAHFKILHYIFLSRETGWAIGKEKSLNTF